MLDQLVAIDRIAATTRASSQSPRRSASRAAVMYSATLLALEPGAEAKPIFRLAR